LYTHTLQAPCDSEPLSDFVGPHSVLSLEETLCVKLVVSSGSDLSFTMVLGLQPGQLLPREGRQGNKIIIKKRIGNVLNEAN
jgi:hypothetical protein